MRRAEIAWAVATSILLLAGAAQAIPPEVTGYSPARTTPGSRLTLEGRNFGREQGDLRIRYGQGERTRGNVSTVYSWSARAIEIQIPTGLAAGRYWFAIFRGERLRSNRLTGLEVVHVQVPSVVAPLPEVVRAAGSLAAARVTEGPTCRGKSVLRLEGGPFEPGTGGYVRGYGHLLREGGSTWVEVTSDERDEDSFWNRMIFKVTVRSESQLDVEIGRCFPLQPNAKIRVIFPNGSKSSWVAVHNPL